MKKVMLGLAAIVCCVVVNAQVSFGVNAGLNNSTLGGDGADLSGKKSNTAFNAGVMLVVPISTDFVFQPEIMYSGIDHRLPMARMMYCAAAIDCSSWPLGIDL